jgi:hypothetical protein
MSNPVVLMPTAKRTALVTGASGLAGGYMLAHLLEQGGWDIVAVSRRKPRIPGDYRYIAVDLLDPADCRTKLGPLTNISHLFYPDHSVTVEQRPRHRGSFSNDGDDTRTARQSATIP